MPPLAALIPPPYVCMMSTYMYVGPFHLAVLSVPIAQLQQATFVGLEFTNQKNGIHGEVIGLAWSGSHLWCPVATIICQVIYLWSITTRLTTPLYSYESTIPCHGMCAIQATQLTLHLHAAAQTISMPYGILPVDISACSL